MTVYCSQCGREFNVNRKHGYSHCSDHSAVTLQHPTLVKVGMTVSFTYSDKPRVVQIERILCENQPNACINGPELTDNGQIKSFTLAKIEGDIVRLT